MDNNSDSEYEIEEALVLVELNGIIDADFLLQAQDQTKFLGIETDEPILQIGNCLFKGEYEDTVGTVIVYEPTDTSKTDASETIENSYEFLCKTDKKLTMKRCFPREKNAEKLKPTEPCNLNLVQNGSFEKPQIDASEAKNARKVQVNSEKKEIKFPKPKQRKKVIKTNKDIDKKSSDSKREDQTLKSEASGESKSNKELTGNIKLINSNLNPPSISKSTNLIEKKSVNHSENTDKISRKRDYDEANANTIDSDRNADESSTNKKKYKEGHIDISLRKDNDEKCAIEISKENLEVNNTVNNSCQSSEESSVIEMKDDRTLSESVEEGVIRELDSELPCLSYEEIQRKSKPEVINANEEASCNEVSNNSLGDEIKFLNNDVTNNHVESSVDNTLLFSSSNNIKDNDCSSSDDNQHARNESISQLDACKSSEGEVCELTKTRYIKEINNNSPSTYQVNKNDIEIEPNVMDETEAIESDSVDSLNKAAQHSNCEVSQSEKINTYKRFKHTDEKENSNECEDFDSSVDPIFEPISASDMINLPSAIETAASNSRKLSSCEVTQSVDSDKSYTDGKFAVDESDVFFPIALPNENFLNNDANETETQFKVNQIDSRMAEHSEVPFKSESSTSEISQSHKSVIKESKFCNEISETATEGEVCSQSTDQLCILSDKVSDEPKDLCVSSCNIDGESQYENSVEEEMQYSAEIEYPLWVGNETDIICEVSQSDKSENSISVNSEMSGNEIQVLSNECDESVSNLSGNLNYSAVEPQDSDESNRNQEDIDVPSTSINIPIMCEVTQSTSKARNVIVTDLPVDPNNSNECEMYKANDSPVPTPNDKHKDNCVSSDDVSYFSGPLLETKVEGHDKDLNCEVSQSFKSLEADESCVSSETKTKESADTVEVSQSLKLESTTSCNFDSDNGDFGRAEINYDFVKPFSKQSDDYSEEMCVSSDDIASATSDVEFNSQMEEEQSVNQSTCEVSQSFRSEDRILIIPTGQLAGTEIESSNECEMYATCMETAQVVNQQDKNEKNICESSDDVNERTRDIQHPFIQSEDIFDEACQSSKLDENVISSETRARIYRKNSSECESSDERNESFNENGMICESSEYMLSGSIYAEPNFDACSSSEKSIEKYSCDSPDHQDKCYESSLNQNLTSVVTVDETENNQISQSFNAATDSDDLLLNETENNQISQSGNILDCSSNVTIEIENNQISQSGNSAGCSSGVMLNETENNQISQSGNTASPTSNTVSKEIENDQISQSNNNTECSNEISVNEMENNQISQSSTVVDRSSNISAVEMESNQISQSGSVPSRSSDVSVIERENNQISQSINAAGCSDDIIVDEIYNNQISQSSSTPNSSSNIVLIEVENNHISQSSSNAGSSSEVSLIENGQISQSESDDKVYYSNDERNGLSSDSSFETNIVNVSSSGDVISSNYVNVIYSSYHTSNSTISNSEVSPSSISEQPCVWEGDSLLTNPSTSSAGNLSELCHEIEACPTNTISDELNVHSSISVIATTDSLVIPESISTEHIVAPSSNNENEVVESSVSLINEESKLENSVSRIPKRDSASRHIVDEKTSKAIPRSSQTLKRTDERQKQIMKSNCNKGDFSSNSNQRNQSEDSNMLQPSILPHVASQPEIRSHSSSSRPSLLEVIVSSASDFRNSLLSDNSSYSKEKNNVSSVSQSSARNVGSCNEFSESFMGEADGTSGNRSSDAPQKLSFPSEDSEQVDSEISGSIENRKYGDSNELGYNHRVSQSSDIVNTHSSTSKIQSVVLDNISQSSQQDLVQSSSNTMRTSVLVSNDSVPDQVSSAVENNIFVQKSSNNVDASESSTGTNITLPSCSESHSFSVQIIQSSDDKFVFAEDISDFKPENVESVVSSTPSDLHCSNLNVLSYDGNEQCPTVEGNVIIVHQSDDNVTTVEVVSPDSDCLTYMPDLNSRVDVVEASNEAETLNHSSVSSPVQIQFVPLGQIAVSGGDESEMNIEASGSNLSVNEIEVMTKAYECEGSSEVSESLETEQSISQSSFPDNSVSCSVSEFPANQRGMIKNFSFLDNEFGSATREAESKTSDDCILSYESDMFPVQNLPSSENKDLSMYSHIGEFDDSIQSSSLDETHLCINEQIKAISSPPNSSDSGSYMSQTPLSIGPFVTFSSQTHALQSDQCGDSSFSKITSSLTTEELNSAVDTNDSNLYSNDISEIGESNGVIIMPLPNENSQIISTAGNDVIVESLNPEQIENIYETAQNPVISENLEPAEQYVEMHEQIIPVVPNSGNSNIVVSSNDQLEENSVVPNVTFPTDPQS